MPTCELGDPLPPNVAHAISVTIPTWEDNIGYEERDKRVMSKLLTAYPRFLIHQVINAFANDIIESFGNPDLHKALLFPSSKAAGRCVDFLFSKDATIVPDSLRTISLTLDHRKTNSQYLKQTSPSISAVIYPSELFPYAKEFWQHTGEGVSSRYAEFCRHLFEEGILVEEKELTLKSSLKDVQKACKGPRRYQQASLGSPTSDSFNKQSKNEGPNGKTTSLGSEIRESSLFLEERFGRNLDVSLVDSAKSAIRRRIAGILVGEQDFSPEEHPGFISNARGTAALTEDDVFLWPCGMNSIFHTHRKMLEARGPMKSISFGFPYVDTLKILQKFGPGCVFYGHGTAEEFDHLEERLKAGEKFLALFCEFPGNPLLKCVDLKRIRKLADTYDFAVVIDETIGNLINVNVLPYADVVVSSLTKVFSGECNAMGGCCILNPNGQYYNIFKEAIRSDYEDFYWAEDAIFMERNSRDLVKRIKKMNQNAEAICSVLRAHSIVKDIYYPKLNSTKGNYDACRTLNGGYGGLISFTFHKKDQAIAFYDRIETAKGPSLGTNFTLTSPYVILAHYFELDWAAEYGLPADLIRVSVGIEDQDDLISKFEDALKVAEEIEP
ncbi:Cystathionine gamma-synthase [Podosphaera aphanis]|nr:Cystathionine gamma-synthase [Podosphaera aphanis]